MKHLFSILLVLNTFTSQGQANLDKLNEIIAKEVKENNFEGTILLANMVRSFTMNRLGMLMKIKRYPFRIISSSALLQSQRPTRLY